MSLAVQWLAVAVLCCAAVAAEAADPPDPRLQEAQQAFDEANRLKRAGEYARAEPLFERALAIREAALGPSHPLVANSLNNLALVYSDQGLYARAESLHERALAIREATLGKLHPDVAQSLNNLALVYRAQGLYARAEPLHERALAIREAAHGENHPLVASSLNNLATLYIDQGLYTRAEPLYERALAIREAALGQHHPDVALSLSNIALVYRAQGLNAQAEALFNRALAIWEAAHGKNHSNVALALNNLALVYRDQGMYARAEPLFERALAIWEAAHGKHHPYVAQALSNLASIDVAQGLYARAEPLFERALTILETTLGKHHPLVADLLNNLAAVHMRRGLYARAEPLFEQALAIQEAAHGKHHLGVAPALSNLASLHRDQGRYAQAEPLFERAQVIWEAALGKHHPDVANHLNERVLFHLAQHRVKEAIPLIERVFSISEQRLRQEALGFSESRLTSFLGLLREEEERLYSLLRHHPADASVQRLAITAVLLRKGRSAEEIADTSRTIYRNLSPQDRGTFERLRGLRAQLAQLSLNGPGPLPPSVYQQRLQALGDEGDALEADLARRSAPLRALTALPPPTEIVDRVAAALPSGTALVEFVAYEDRPLVPRPGTPVAKAPPELHYLALVLLPDARIQALDLGPAAAIDRAASNLRDALARRDAAFQRPAQKLYSLAFQPLLPLLGDARRLVIAPDGELGLIPFAALHDGKSFLVDSFDISYLNSGKDLLPRPQEFSSATSVVVLADPAFATSSATPSTPRGDTPSEPQRSLALERFFSTQRRSLARQPWTPLPGTRREAAAIHRLLPQAQLFLGSEATKQRLLQLATPGVLHVATHGFFLDGSASLNNTRGVGQFGGFGDGTPAHLPDDPLLRSGLVLTGARAFAAPEASAATTQAENSLVTALELAGLDLWGTQLVVLSACDTGRGDIKRGQGVYGLRRAFTIAGAETVVMSLWKVNDDSTSTLMEDFYRHLLAGKGRAEALREAIRTLRETRPHPYYWAPFITLGQDGPLRSLAPGSQEHTRLFPSIRNMSPEPR